MSVVDPFFPEVVTYRAQVPDSSTCDGKGFNHYHHFDFHFAPIFPSLSAKSMSSAGFSMMALSIFCFPVAEHDWSRRRPAQKSTHPFPFIPSTDELDNAPYHLNDHLIEVQLQALLWLWHTLAIQLLTAALEGERVDEKNLEQSSRLKMGTFMQTPQSTKCQNSPAQSRPGRGRLSRCEA